MDRSAGGRRLTKRLPTVAYLRLYHSLNVAILHWWMRPCNAGRGERPAARQLAEREAELDVARAQIEALTFHLAVLRRRQFGRSSEKLDAEIEQLELRLEDLEESQAEQGAASAHTG